VVAFLTGCGSSSAVQAQEDRERPDRFADPPVGEHLELSEAEWRRRLTPAEFDVLREQGTEPAFSGRFHDHHEHGLYRCAGCGAPLFRSEHKFESGTGWPSFWQPIADGRVDSETDSAYGMMRTEVHCARCGGHLGHVFEDGPEPTGLRYCINSVSLDFEASDPAR
jgi:peptide-methionine (R)-S-oxide reductase